MRVSVDREKCIGCTICVALAPQVMEMDSEGKAVPIINRPSLGQTCFAGSANGLRVLFAHAVMNCSFAAFD